jgi:probable rRNA maturation factor
MSFTLTNTTTYRSAVPFLKIKEEILGKEYQLSLALVGEKRAREVNRLSRHKDYAPNVLSFPLSRHNGEIYIAPSIAKKEAPAFGHSFKRHLTFLYIHGLLHLKGYDHGRTMEKLEEKYLAKYG